MTDLQTALRRLGNNFVVISAAKADKSEQENKERNARLAQTILDFGYTPYPATGHYVYKDGTSAYEDSYVVYDVPELLKLGLGRIYDQESVLDQHGLHFISKGTVAPFYNSGHHIGASARKQPAWLEYPLGRGAISLAIDFNKEHKI